MGAALWLPPGVSLDFDAIGSLLQRTVAESLLADLFAVFSQMPEYHPHEPHWYLAAIGIDPSRQNQGQGAALIEHALPHLTLRSGSSPPLALEFEARRNRIAKISAHSGQSAVLFENGRWNNYRGHADLWRLALSQRCGRGTDGLRIGGSRDGEAPISIKTASIQSSFFL